MMTRIVVLAIAVALAGCDRPPAAAGAGQGAACMTQPGAPGVPTVAFRDYLATRPTQADFRARHPGITLVMPGDIATRELRLDCSRFFADTDIEGRIVGGRFG